MTIVVENAPLETRPLRRPPADRFADRHHPVLRWLLLNAVFGGQATFDSFGWRIPFIAAIPMLAVAIYIRSKLNESPVFEALMEPDEIEHAPIRGVLTKSWRHILVGMAAALLGVGGFYLITSFVVYYGTKVHMLGYYAAARSLMAAVVEIFAPRLGGRMGEKFGASNVILWGRRRLRPHRRTRLPGHRHWQPCPGHSGHDRRGGHPVRPVRGVRHGADRTLRHERSVHRRRHHLQARGVISGFVPLIATASWPPTATRSGPAPSSCWWCSR